MRPELARALDYVRESDTLIEHSIDRSVRNLDDLRHLVKTLTDKGARVECVKESLTFTGDDSHMGKLMLSVMGAFTEFERSLIPEHQREGIALTKFAGNYRGGRPKLTPDQAAELARHMAAGGPVTALAREFGISRQTAYRYTEDAKAAASTV